MKHKPFDTPWGPSQTAKLVAPGLWHYTTASHGGFSLSPARFKELPAALQKAQLWAGTDAKGVHWYEEDCDWCIPYLGFASLFRFAEGVTPAGNLRYRQTLDHARQTLLWAHPAVYGEFYGVPVEVNAEGHGIAAVAICDGKPASTPPERDHFEVEIGDEESDRIKNLYR